METRREFLSYVMALASVNLLAGCGFGTDPPTEAGDARLTARPGTPTGAPDLGLHPLGLGTGRDGLVYVPASYRPDHPLPLVLLLHGAGHSADEMMTPHMEQSIALGLEAILVAVDSRSSTWDGVLGSFGPDVHFINQALDRVFSRCAVDPTRVVVTGFSDGATDAIAMGRSNGDLFRRVVCYSPGFLLPVKAIGLPPFFITHGTKDPVLSIDTTRQVIVPGLRNAGYEVEFHEWDGGHGVSMELLGLALQWMVA